MPVAPNTVTLFIAHSTRNRNELKTLRESIDGKTIDSYILRAIVIDPLLGQSISKDVIDGLEKSDLFIVLITKESLQSVWVNQEIGYAMKKFTKNKIIPIVEESQLKELEGFITKDDKCAIFKEGDMAPAIQELETDLKRRLVEQVNVPPMVSTQIASITATGFQAAFIKPQEK